MHSGRMVLFPYGQAQDARLRDACTSMFIRLGGDVSRVIDGPFPSIERFCDHVRRLRAVTAGSEPPIVILTRTNPLGLAVLNARRRIESTIPALRVATWVVVVDTREDPFFDDNAHKLGNLEPQPDGGVKWSGPDHAEFTVLYDRARAA